MHEGTGAEFEFVWLAVIRSNMGVIFICGNSYWSPGALIVVMLLLYCSQKMANQKHHTGIQEEKQTNYATEHKLIEHS